MGNKHGHPEVARGDWRELKPAGQATDQGVSVAPTIGGSVAARAVAGRLVGIGTGVAAASTVAGAAVGAGAGIAVGATLAGGPAQAANRKAATIAKLPVGLN